MKNGTKPTSQNQFLVIIGGYPCGYYAANHCLPILKGQGFQTTTKTAKGLVLQRTTEYGNLIEAEVKHCRVTR